MPESGLCDLPGPWRCWSLWQQQPALAVWSMFPRGQAAKGKCAASEGMFVVLF